MSIEPTALAREEGTTEGQAATECILSNTFLLKKVLEADKSLRDGEHLLTHDEVFGVGAE